MSRKRILIVSQYSLFDQGLRAALSQQPGVEVVGVYRDLEAAYAQAKDLHPDVLVLIAQPEVARDNAFRLLEEVSSSIIRISPTDGTMQVYRREHVGSATLDDLMEAIQMTASRWKTEQGKVIEPQTVATKAGGVPQESRRTNMRHFIVAGVLVAVITVLVFLGLSNAPILPQLASAEGSQIDWLFRLHLRVIAFLFALIVVLTLYSVVVFRRKPGDTSDGLHTHGNTRLEIIWTVLPLITVLYFGVLGAQQLADITAPAPDELVVNVAAQQFAWSFNYPDSGITSAELNLPLGRKVLLKLQSRDVIHSFWVPEFRLKQDAVPGMTTELRITPTQAGAYRVRCAELCGTAHYAMIAPVNVMEPVEFAAWVKQNTPAPTPTPAAPGETGTTEVTGAQLGAQLAQSQSCLGCHSVDGSQLVGPTWLGLYANQVTLQDGTTVEADEAYLRRSILETNAQVVQGFPASVMPRNYGETLSGEQVNALIDYIKSLSE